MVNGNQVYRVLGNTIPTTNKFQASANELVTKFLSPLHVDYARYPVVDMLRACL